MSQRMTTTRKRIPVSTELAQDSQQAQQVAKYSRTSTESAEMASAVHSVCNRIPALVLVH